SGYLIDRHKLADAVLEKLGAMGGGDAQFAAWFAAERVRQGKSGSRKIVSELMSKGISQKMAQQAVAAVAGDEGELQAKLLMKKYGVASLKEIKDLNLKAKAYRYLASKGFTRLGN